MIIDLAVSAGSLVAQIRNQLVNTHLVVCDELGPPFAGMVFDRVEFETPTLSQRQSSNVFIRLADGSQKKIDGHRIRIEVVAHAVLASRKELLDGGVNGASDVQRIAFTLQFDLRGVLDSDDDGVVTARTDLTYRDMNPKIPDPTLRALVEARLADIDQSTPVPLARLEKILGRGVAVRNFGIAVDAAGKRVVTRLEVETTSSNPVQSWETFYASPPDRRDGNEWALFIDQRLLVTLAEEGFADQLRDQSSRLSVEEPPVGVWHPDLPGLQLYSYLNVIEACPNSLDIGAELFVASLLSLTHGPGGANLTIVTSLRWNVIDSDVLACGLTFGGLIGLGIGAVAGGLIGAAVGGLIGTALVTAVGGIYADFKGLPDQELDKGCQKTEEDDDHIVTTCRRALDLGEQLGLRLAPKTLAGMSDGLVIRGSIEVPFSIGSLLILVTPLGWSEDLNCNTRSVDVSLTGGASFVDSRLAQLTTCTPQVVDDALGFFSAEWVEPGAFAIGVNDAVADQYYDLAKRYPCRVLVRTNLGARILDFGDLKRPRGPEDFGDITPALAKYCFRAHSDFWHSHLSFEWLVDPDPPFKDAVVEHLWDIVATGLRSGDTLQVMHGRNDLVARAPANEQGVVRLRAVVPSSQSTLSVGRVGTNGQSIDEPFDPKRHVVGVTQTLLVARGRTRLAGRCIELARLQVMGRTQLVAVTDVGLEVWESRGAQVLALRTRVRDIGLEGMVATRRGLITYGERGVRRFESQEDGRLVRVAGISETDRPIVEALTNGTPDVARRLAGNWPARTREGAPHWFAETVRFGPWLARLEGDRDTVVVYSVGRRTPVRIPFPRG